jgi:hypothetical protein
VESLKGKLGNHNDPGGPDVDAAKSFELRVFKVTALRDEILVASTWNEFKKLNTCLRKCTRIENVTKELLWVTGIGFVVSDQAIWRPLGIEWSKFAGAALEN